MVYCQPKPGANAEESRFFQAFIQALLPAGRLKLARSPEIQPVEEEVIAKRNQAIC
jgi:hypothetical protein